MNNTLVFVLKLLKKQIDTLERVKSVNLWNYNKYGSVRSFLKSFWGQ